ncbi:MAG: hypothetical protein ACYTDW_08995 [Planctomycetota bacterium]|jgi:hypothetical protein
MKKNRDLYKSIESLIKQKEDHPIPSLERYLTNLLRLATQVAHKEALDLEEFFLLLHDSFDESGDVSEGVCVEDGVPQFYEWKAEVNNRIQDLRDMAENKQLENEYRYFGISAPSGRYWYNFDPLTYIECGAAGSLSGWEEGDETGRSYVPGPVAYLDSEGKISSCDPRELDRLPVEVPLITWEKFSEFVWCGQNYE